MDPSIDTSPIAPALAEFFDEVLDQSVSQLNFKAIVDGLGDVLFKYPFSVPSYYSLILRSLTVLEGLALQADPRYLPVSYLCLHHVVFVYLNATFPLLLCVCIP